MPLDHQILCVTTDNINPEDKQSRSFTPLSVIQPATYTTSLVVSTTQMFPELTSKTCKALSAQMVNNYRLFDS